MEKVHYKPVFSVIIPTYNHAEFICKCLDSILAQTFSSWEVIVVNNFSEDNTIELVKSYNDDRIRLINFSNNGIIAASRNTGIRAAKGEWICFLDSDDWWYPDKLEISSQLIQKTDIIYHDLDIIKNGRKVYFRKIKGRHLRKNHIKDLIINGNAVPNSSVVVRKSILDKVGCISEKKELVAVEDSDYWIRVASITERFYYIPKSLGAYHVGNNFSVSEKQIEREIALFNAHKSILTINENRLAVKSLSLKIARIYHKIGFFNKAIQNYKKSLTIQRPLSSIKVYILLFMCLINRLKKRNNVLFENNF